jgi:hypothetical protein
MDSVAIELGIDTVLIKVFGVSAFSTSISNWLLP